MHNNVSDNIRKVSYCALLLIGILFVYVSYVQIVESSFLASHPLNRRATEYAKHIERGQILDKNHQKIAVSEKNNAGDFIRKYPYNGVFAQIIGYDSIQYGKTGLESYLNGYLSGISNPEHNLGPISHLLANRAGDNVILTLDAKLQQTAYNALGSQRGAVVAMNPQTGAILAMVSKPSFDPNTIDKQWDNLIQSAASPLLNRATQGLYPPGSSIKPMIADGALRENIVNLQQTFNCEGSLKIGPDYVLTESHLKAHGKVNLEEALAESCNITFGTLSMKLGRSKMSKLFDQYGFSKAVGAEFQEATSHLPDFNGLGDGDLAQTGIGQSSLLVTPLRMAMLASTFANRGITMKPYIISQITTQDGSVVKEFSPEIWLTPSNAQVAEEVKQMMVTVVKAGTGGAANISGILVGGKTGTAENPHGDPHSWFIGFAPADNPQIAITVIVENGGFGGEVAAPVARQVLVQALR